MALSKVETFIGKYDLTYLSEKLTPLEQALKNGNKASIRGYIEKGAHISNEELSLPIMKEMIKEDRSILLPILEERFSLMEKSKDIYKPSLANYLIAEGDWKSLIYLFDNYKESPFQNTTTFVLIKLMLKGKNDIAKLLMKKISSFNQSELPVAIMVAESLGYKDIWEMLMEKVEVKTLNEKVNPCYIERIKSSSEEVKEYENQEEPEKKEEDTKVPIEEVQEEEVLTSIEEPKVQKVSTNEERLISAILNRDVCTIKCLVNEDPTCITELAFDITREGSDVYIMNLLLQNSSK